MPKAKEITASGGDYEVQNGICKKIAASGGDCTIVTRIESTQRTRPKEG